MHEQSIEKSVLYGKLLERIQESVKSPTAEFKSSLDPFQQAYLDDQTADTKLKWKYANWSLRILLGQLLVMNAVFILVGFGWLKFPATSNYLQIYMSGTLAEVFGIVFLITRYLFAKRNKI